MSAIDLADARLTPEETPLEDFAEFSGETLEDRFSSGAPAPLSRVAMRVAVVGFVIACGPSAEQLANGSWHDARVVCEDFVTRRLKAPSTATITTRDTTVMLEPKHWRSTGSYDAHNGFGATLRGYFVCDARYTGNGNYSLIELTMRDGR